MSRERLSSFDASNFVGLESYDDSRLIVSKHDGESYMVGRAYFVSPISGGGGDFLNSAADLLRGLSEGSVLQILETSFPDKDAPGDFLRNKNHPNEILSRICESQANLYKGALKVGWQKDTPPLNAKRLIVTLSLPAKNLEDETLDGQRRIQQAFASNLRAYGFPNAEVLSPSQLLGAYRGIVETKQPYPVDLDPVEELRRQAFGPNVIFDFDGILTGKINERHVVAVGVKYFPKLPKSGLMNYVKGAPMNGGPALEGGGARVLAPWMLCTTIRVASQRQERTRVERAISSRSNSEKLPVNFKMEDQGAVLKDLQLLEKQCASESDVYVKASTTALVFGDSREEALQHADAFCSTFNRLDFQAYPMNSRHGMMFAQMLPMNYSIRLAQNQDNEVVMSGRAATRLLPLYSEYTGKARYSKYTGSMYLTRCGEAYYYNPFLSDSNFNGLMAAASGAGKSATMQYEVTVSLAQGERVFILDNGSSARKLAGVLPEYAEFQDFDANSSSGEVSLNPFTHLTHETFAENADEIASLYLQMAYFGIEPDRGADIVLTEAVKAAWESKQNDADISSVIEALEATAGQAVDAASEIIIAAKNLVPRLKSFMDSPTRGRFFSGPNTLSPKAQLTVYELNGLGGDEHLKQCVLFFLTNAIMDTVTGTKGKKRIYIDEAWELLLGKTGGAIKKAVESLYRKGRKSGASTWVVTQDIDSLVKDPVGEVILSQSEWKFILMQNEDSVNNIIKANRLAPFTTDEYFCRLLRDVTTVRGSFAEVMIVGKGAYEVVRLYLSEFALAVFNTDQEDRDRVFALMDSGVSALDAIQGELNKRAEGRRQWLREIASMLTGGSHNLSVPQAISEFKQALGITE
jgi:conjugal transfer ATP-binding protein TraC